MSEIKICGLFREEDIDYVNEAKPDYIGFIVDFPKSHRNVDPARALALRQRLLPGIRAVGVFVDQPAEAVLSTTAQIGLDVIQLHGHEDNEYIASLRKHTSLPVWKAFRIRTKDDLAAAESSLADEVLLDNGYGTGQTFDWSLLSGFPRPFLLAGGLTPDNIPEALRLSRPKLVDISSGVETGQVKDKHKIQAAVRAARTSQA